MLKNMKNVFKVINLGKITGVYYSCGQKTNNIVVWALGGPTVPDNGNLSSASIILKRKCDIFVPDYIGFGRSAGVFTPINCINTLLLTFKYLKTGKQAISAYDNIKLNLKYKKIIFVGKSLGGAYVPLLPRFNKKIKDIAVFCGALDQSEQGKEAGEETNEDFMRTIISGGYKYLYRGFVKNKAVWWNHLNDKDDLSPMDNIDFLEKTNIFIAHGIKDEIVHYSKAVNFHNSVRNTFPKKINYKLKLYKNGDHGYKTVNKATRDFLDWIGVKYDFYK